MTPLGQTRTRVASDHAVIASDGFVTSPLYPWQNTEGVVLISPAMHGGSETHRSGAKRGPNFAMYLANLTSESRLKSDNDIQRLLYVLDGEISVGGQTLKPQGYAYLPPHSSNEVECEASGRLLVFEKPYAPLPNVAAPDFFTDHVGNRPSEAFMGDESAQLANLLPTTPAFDMAVNVFTFQPGTPLPFVETHVMEHGLHMTAGQGVYRLGENWYPVGKGDSIWMAAYCPQWFVAMGKEPAQYIYYKDVHRSVLQ